MGELEFSRKPHRMTSPPHNQRKWLEGIEGTRCKLETDPTRIAVLCREATWGSVYDLELTPELVASTLKEIQGGKVLGAALEVPALAFVMRSSRVTMDQLLRLRESAGAAHTTRDNDFRDFNIIVPDTINMLCKDGDRTPAELSPAEQRERELYCDVATHVHEARKLYGRLVDAGVPPQDARYIALPMGYQGDWVQVMNLRALVKECEHRMCNGLVQWEANYAVRLQRDAVVAQWPWMDPMLRSMCEKRGKCMERTMLFPPCGAYDDGNNWRAGAQQSTGELFVHHYDPEKHLYPTEQNASMEFAQWDVARQKMERENPDLIFCMAGPPQVLVDRAAYDEALAQGREGWGA